jgi:hypothetical protein
MFILVLMHSTLFGQIFRTVPRRVERQAPAATLSPANAKLQLQRLAEEAKANPRKFTENDLARCQKLLLDAVNDLQRRLPREFDRTEANDWSITFKLAELRATLAQKTPDPEILGAVQVALYADKEGTRWTQFDGLRTALRRYQTVAGMIKEDNYERQLTNVCDNLIKYIDTYSEGRDPAYLITMSNITAWFDDVSIFEPRVARLAELTRIACSGVNVRLQVGSEFVAAGFQTNINEELDINETILGTKVVGDGVLTGTSSAELVASSPNRAIIKVMADAVMETDTTGSQAMVKLKNHTSGTLRAEKQILFSAEGITTAPAKAKANLRAKVSDVQINAGPLVRMVARNQIDDRKEDSLAEASRRAERRINARMNEQIDPNIAKLNEKYQKIRQPLAKRGLFPRVWNLSSAPQQVNWSVQLGDTYQPSAPIPAPAVNPTNGLSVQVHQSALNNMLTIALAGRSVDEEKFAEQLKEFFDEVPEFLKRETSESPAQVSFDGRRPVEVTFLDNKIRVVVRLTDIQVSDNVGRSFTITIEYQVKMEKRDGRDVIVLERTEAEAFPTGFRPDSGETLSTVQTVIRSYLMRRLEELPKRREAEPLELGGQWADKGQLMPQFASTEKGWITLVWNWKPAK